MVGEMFCVRGRACLRRVLEYHKLTRMMLRPCSPSSLLFRSLLPNPPECTAACRSECQERASERDVRKVTLEFAQSYLPDRARHCAARDGVRCVAKGEPPPLTFVA